MPAGVPTPTTLPADPKVVWHSPVGFGLGSPIVAGGKVFYLDAQAGQETLHAADAASGRELWSAPVDRTFLDTQSQAGPRGTPMADGDRVYAQSCQGEFQCRDAQDGKLRWRVNFVKDFGALFFGEHGAAVGASRHGYTDSPVIDGERILVGAGGTNGASIVCFDKRNGQVRWKSQNDVPGHSGPVIATLGGVRQAVSFTAAGVMSVATADGALLWRVPVKSSIGRHITTPVIVGDMVVVASHQAGLVGIRVTPAAEGFKATTVYADMESAINFSSPVAVGPCLYGVGPAKNLICVDIPSGKQRWSKEGYFQSAGGRAYAAFIVMGDRILMLTDGGLLVLFAADPSQCRELSATQVCGNNWCNPAYADGRLYLRDQRELRCVQLLPE